MTEGRPDMKGIYKRIVVIATFLFLLLSPLVAKAEETDVMCCGSVTVIMRLSESEDLSVSAFEGKGVVRSNVEKRAFDNCSFQVLGIDTIIAGKRTQFGNSKFMDSDGDFVVMENFVPLGSKEATWKFIYGTGKWKGIKGGGKTEAAVRVKSIAPDTRQLCFRNTGTFELPK